MIKLGGRWPPGTSIVRRDVWRGHVRSATPARVVEDSDDAIVFYVAPGSTYFLPTNARGDMSRSDIQLGADWRRRVWTGGGALHHVRAGDSYATVALWDHDGALRCWYVNLQRPLVRTPIRVDTMDYILDVVVSPDWATAAWKDEEVFLTQCGATCSRKKRPVTFGSRECG